MLPIFLVSTLGVGMLAVGIIEGIAEATASVMKLFSGALSDWVGRRKPLVLLGYWLAALTKHYCRCRDLRNFPAAGATNI